ncbi:MAG: amidase [Candidatus Velthaea sp.]
MTVPDRTTFLAVCSTFGLSATLLPGVLYAMAEDKGKVTRAMIDDAAAVADVRIADEHKDAMLDALTGFKQDYDAVYALHVPNSVAPALVFDPLPAGTKLNRTRRPLKMSAPPNVRGGRAPRNIEDLAFATVRELADAVRGRAVSATALTDMYIARLKRLDPTLKFAITLTEERARVQAREADRDIAVGRYRGPLHGIPWGAKDLLAVKGYRTTWGAGGFERQTIDEDATVVKRLDAAGAILIAKLTLGALAQGDKWFGGQTRNPWNPQQGSSGSSAGPASATAAGCVGFAIGSETLGSISSPSTRCGTTGLRPTFGLVPRTGAMALSWSMDKIGPLCRAVEDCALVLHAIYGPDGHDRTVRDAAFNWDATLDWRTLRVGYLQADFTLAAPPPELPKDEKPLTPDEQKARETAAVNAALGRARREYDHRYDVAALERLRRMGVNLIAVDLPKYPYGAMLPILLAEGAAAFDELTRSGRDALLTEQSRTDWPNTFRTARFIPAVEYIQANRARMLAIDAFAKVFQRVDVIVAPTGSAQLTATNLTGHPALIVPNGLRGGDAPRPRTLPSGDLEPGGPGTPVSLTFIGQLYGEGKLLAFGKAYQDATGFHRTHPALAR